MIVPMKKVYVLTLESRLDRTVEELGGIGVLHVNTEQSQKPSLSSDISHKLDRIQRAIRLLVDEPLEYHDIPETLQTDGGNVDASAVVSRLLELDERLAFLQDTRDQLEDEKHRIQPWENADPELLRELDNSDCRVYLYRLSPDRYARFGGEGTRFVVRQEKTLVHVLLVQRGGEQPPAGYYPRPEKTLDEVARSVEQTEREMNAIREEMRMLSSFSRTLVDEQERLLAEEEYLLVRGTMQEDGPVRYITGWVPEDTVSTVRKAASEHGWGLLIQEPESDDAVPVHIRRKGVSRLIAPVFDLIKTVPGYHERDISFPFLVFFTVFFAMIISDAGYGLLLFTTAIVLTVSFRKQRKTVGPPILLLYVLSLATVFWGSVTGVWFGYEPLSETAFLGALVVPALNNFEAVSTENLLFICFTLAAMQLSVAHLWNTIDELRGSHKLKALGELGWLSVVLAVYNLVLNLVVNEEVYPLLDATPIAAGVGVVAVILFSNQEGNFFRGVAKGLSVPNLIQTALSSINAFADTVSYIRLFAVGLASVEIAIAANELAIGTGNPVAMIIILLIGHSLNVAMGGMSVLVHGIRLNMLEFSGHLGMEWSGSEYKPFQYVRQS